MQLLIARGGGECLHQVIVGPHRERRGICISLNRTPAGVALSHWGQINRAIIRLNTPHFTASCSFAVKHCCTWGLRACQSDSACFVVSMCVFSPTEGYIYSCCYIDIISRVWTLFDDGVHGAFLHSFMIVELHRANSTILRKPKSWSCAIHFAVYVLQYNCFSFAIVMHLFGRRLLR